jgi:hypothetical protein
VVIGIDSDSDDLGNIVCAACDACCASAASFALGCGSFIAQFLGNPSFEKSVILHILKHKKTAPM